MIKHNIIFKENLPYSQNFHDIFFQSKEESEYVFLQANNLLNEWKNKDKYIILELGFGSGLNFLNVFKAFKEDKNAPKRLFFVSIEAYPLSLEDLKKIHSNFCNEELKLLLDAYPILTNGIHRLEFKYHDKYIILDLCFDKVDKMLENLHFKADCIFHDGFNPKENLDMWNERVFELLANLSKTKTRYSTFSAATKVNKNLTKYGFLVQKIKGFGKKREMITASFIGDETIDKKAYLAIPNFDIKEKKVLIIGAGIAGVCSAIAFLKRGYEVSILEQNENAASMGSGNICGILTPQITKPHVTLSKMQNLAFLYAREFYKQIDENLANFEGSYEFVHNDLLMQRYEYYKNFKSDFFETCIKHDKKCFYSKLGGYAQIAKICQKIVSFKNIKFYPNTKVLSFIFKDNSYEVKTNNKIFTTPLIVVCAGINSLDFFDNKHILASVLRGQVTLINKQFDEKIPYSDKGYITPFVQNTHVVGATYKRGNLDKNISKEDEEENLNNVKIFLKNPQIIGANVGFRLSSSDRFALIGAIEDERHFIKNYKSIFWNKQNLALAKYLPNIFLNTAFSSKGLSIAPLAGELIASMTEKEPLNLEKNLIHEISPSRYILRSLKKGLIKNN